MKPQSQFSIRLLWLVFAVALAGCSTGQKNSETQAGENPETLVQISGTEDPSKAVMENISKPYQSPLGEIPLDVTPLTEQWIKYFQGKGRRYMEVYLQRSSRYLPMMKNTLRENQLPEDLVYVALIESGFSPLAHSHANAVGYWQFIRSTGKRYGLMVDPFIDERRDPVLSTRAAAEYFKALYNLFGSWHLALAAYNVGENRVKRAVMTNYTRDFWQLIKKRRSFPRETKHYVPKFIAAALIAKEPEKYGFKEIAYEPPLAFDTVQLANPISMTKFASQLNMDVEVFRLLNPKFRGDFVPQYRGAETVIRVPVGLSQVASAAIPAAVSAVPKVLANEFYFYRVRSGDTLGVIARRHRTSINTLRRLNGLGNRSFLRVGQRLKVPDKGGSYVSYEMPAEPSVRASAAPEAIDPGTENRQVNSVSEAEVHVVRRGENLSTIAKKYGLSISQLRRLNNLSQRSILRAGQTLRLKSEDESTNASQSGANPNSRRGKMGVVKNIVAKAVSKAKAKPIQKVASNQKHKVRRGETLAEIADRYRVSVGSIAKKNSIKNRSRLLAGSELVIPRR